jgi:membrane associated rhomboid family serine protease
MTPIWVIMAVNLLFFIASFIREDLIIGTFGFTPNQFPNEPWTIVTNMFVHAGFFHILGNMLMLYFFGTYLLGLVGDKKFLLVYFIAGLMGNLAFLAIGNQFTTAIGASGALYGVMGAMAVMRPRLKVYLWFMIPVDLWIVVIIGALIIAPGIAWQAHLGGLAVGLIAGYYFRRREGGFYWRR